MSKKEAFKNFVMNHPELANHVKNKNYTWQELYEVYDLYGEDEKIWERYKEDTRAIPIAELATLVKGINIANVQKYVANAQKAINIIQELSNKPATTIKNVPKSPRPITKFFGD